MALAGQVGNSAAAVAALSFSDNAPTWDELAELVRYACLRLVRSQAQGTMS